MSETVELYAHNKETYESVKNYWEDGHLRVAVVQATGTGKSYIITKAIHEFYNKNKIVLAPTTYILNNTENLNRDVSGVVYMTYSKLSKLSLSELEDLSPDLIILDEYHRCGSVIWGRAVRKLFKLHPKAKVLGTTATDIRYLDNHRNMSTELFDDCIACTINLYDAINKGILAMPRYVSALYSIDEEVNNTTEAINSSSLPSRRKITLLEKLDGLKSWQSSKGVSSILKKYISPKENKFMVFCKNIEHLNEAKETVARWFMETKLLKDVKTYELYHGKGDNQNAEELDAFEKGGDESFHLLFSIDILNEGIHVPGISGVILLRETISPIIYHQQIGRAMDANSKTNPIIFDFVNNFNNLNGYAFKQALVESRDNILRFGGDVKEIEFTIFDESGDFRSVIKSILAEINNAWGLMYAKLELFYKEYKHSCVGTNDKSLYKWASKQRSLFKRDSLTPEQIENLNKLDFIWDVQEAKWFNQYEKLSKFYKANGHTKITSSIDESLTVWCSTQRARYNEGKLPGAQVKLLNQLDFQWNVQRENWDSKIEELKEFKRIFNHVNVPRKYPENKSLANWCQLQKSRYKEGSLSADKIKSLEDLGFIWDVESHRWMQTFKKIKEFSEEDGSSTNSKHHPMPNNLRDWVYRQRALYRKGRLPQERIDLLLSIGIDLS